MRIERSIDWFEEVMGRPGYTAHVMSAAASDVTEGLAAILMPGRSYVVGMGGETVHDDKRHTYRHTCWIDVDELVLCRDCMHWDAASPYIGMCGPNGRVFPGCGHCSFGEKRKEDE